MHVSIEQQLETELVPYELPRRNAYSAPKTTTIIKRPRVKVFITLTEEEKFIVSQFNLERTVIEEWSEDFSKQQEQALRDERRVSDAMPGLDDKHSLDARLAMIKDLYSRHSKTTKTLGDYLANPYLKIIKTEGEAHLFITNLKEEILPKIKAIFEAHSNLRPKSESFDV